MSGTKAGGIKAAKTNKERHGNDFYGKIGGEGGRNGHTGGFASKNDCNGNCGLSDVFGGYHYKAQCAGYVGGRKSRRTKKVTV